MPKQANHDYHFHSSVYLAMSLLYALGCAGFNEVTIGVGLAICHYFLYRF